MPTPGQRPSSSSRDLTLVVESESVTPEEFFAQVGLSIGRATSNTIYIDHPDVDHIHAKVVKRDESFWLRCEGQAKLQVLDPEPEEVEVVELIPGLTIELGGVIIRCRQQIKGTGSLSDDYWADAAGGERFRVETESFTGDLPKKIGPYEIRKFVARGGMGIVLRGIHQDTDQPAAVKLPTPDLNKDHQWLKRFELEVRTLKSVTHPNLVRLQDAGMEGELHWMAMDWVEGVTVANRIAKAKDASDPIGLYEVQQILLQVVAGLNYLHSRDVVHRDLKPGNLLIGQDGGVKVADFGLAKQVGGEQSTFLTRTGTFAGTMHYMAPEQAEGMEITSATDIYSLGVIWHELLTGRKPGHRLKVCQQRSDCPDSWENILGDCLDDEPADRPSLNAIKAALEAEVFKSDTIKEEERKEQEERRAKQAAKRKAELELLAALESQKKSEKSAQQERKRKAEEGRPVMQRLKAQSPNAPAAGEKKKAATEPKPELGSVGDFRRMLVGCRMLAKTVRGKVLLAAAGIVFLIIGVNLYLLNLKQKTAVQLAQEIAELQGELRPVYETSQKLVLREDHLFYRRKPLEVLNAVSVHFPEELTLDSVIFSESRGSGGNNITLRGKVEQDDRQKLQGYSDQLAKVTVPDSRTQDRRPLFSRVDPPNMDARAGGYLDWYIICLLRLRETALLENSASSGQYLTPAQYIRQPRLVLLLNSQKKLNLNRALTCLKNKKTAIQDELKSMPPLATLKSKLKTLRGLVDTKVVTSQDHARKLMDMVETMARRSGLNITRTRGNQGSARGNKEFDEYKRTISFQTGMLELVDFLTDVSEEQSMIRVSDMKIFPTPGRKYLKVDLTFIASFPKAKIESKPSKKGKKK